MSPEGKSWIQSRTGQANALAEFSSFEPPWQYHHPIRPTSQIPTIPLKMPKQTVVLNALQQYKQNVLSLAFPVVEVSAFEKTIAEAYNFEGPGNSIQLCSQACVLAFLALTSLMVPQTSDFMESLLASESYSTSARILLPLMLKEASIEKLQTLVMLSIHDVFTGNLQEACFTNALATRITFFMGANRCNGSGNGNPMQNRAVYPAPYLHARNLFWLVYILDKELCIRTGHPPSVNDDCCDLDLPEEYMKQFYEGLKDIQVPSQVHFPFDLRLAMIKSKAHSQLYSANAARKESSEILQDIRVLDQELEIWRRSLPHCLRPTMNFKENQHVRHVIDMRIVILQLAYYSCMSYIHEASCKFQLSPEGELLVTEGVNSSLTLAVEASRSLLLYYRLMQPLLENQSFWAMLYYPVSALMTILKGIILRPERQQSHDDLEFLEKGNYWKNLGDLHSDIPEGVQDHLQRLDNFVTDMSRLGKIVITETHHTQE
ncbi:C6 transcription factor [Penicillium hetheringtonii]|uniref:C6 transcription factor n=1 Tax=Penicillium hetheringtonii TaxID=911720 RepID=A0AAD6GQZ9_9EURO|nr:C6 transcription factor [Penicillium hetheringtonii]